MAHALAVVSSMRSSITAALVVVRASVPAALVKSLPIVLFCFILLVFIIVSAVYGYSILRGLIKVQQFSESFCLCYFTSFCVQRYEMFPQYATIFELIYKNRPLWVLGG